MQGNNPNWVSVRLGDDMNWWIDRTSADVGATVFERGVLDPRQVAHFVEALEEYQSYGFRRQQFASAFAVYALDSEVSEGLVRLAATDESIFDTGAQLF